MQRFGRAGRDFSLQAVAILLAEPRWFLEDHQKRLARKRKRSQKGRTKPSSPRTETGARASDVGSSDDELGSEKETSMDAGNENNNLPNGDREGTSDVEEAIKSINITAGGTGKGRKQSTDEVMRLFINAHSLRGRKRCRRFHSNNYYRTADIRNSFILDLRLRFANHFPSLSSAEPPPCCARCMPKSPSICCDICHPDLVHPMINDRDDNFKVVPRGPNRPKRPELLPTSRASQFRDALYDWRTKMATDLFGALDFYPANLFLHEEMLGDIVVFADTNKIVTLQDLRKKTNWILCDQYGDQIISLIRRFFPPAPPPNLFVSTPLPLRTRKKGPTPLSSNLLNSPPRPSSSSAGKRKPQAPSTCTACFLTGHKSTPAHSITSTKY